MGGESESWSSRRMFAAIAMIDEEEPCVSSHFPSEWEFSLVAPLVVSGAIELQVLTELREKGRPHPIVQAHFAQQRHLADNADASLSRKFFARMKIIFEEIDTATACVDPEERLKFLDLGKHTGATGLGISLPRNDGGHQSLLERRYAPRFQLLFANLTSYKLGPPGSAVNKSRKLQVLPFDIRQGQFDMTLLDGHPLRTHVAAEDWHSHRLLVSQFIIALQALRAGGTLVIKLSKPERVRTAQILYMLDVLAEGGITAVKPRAMHATRGTFYAVARGVSGGAARAEVLCTLQELWVQLTFGGDEGTGRFMADGDLDFVVSAKELAEEGRLAWLRAEEWCNIIGLLSSI